MYQKSLKERKAKKIFDKEGFSKKQLPRIDQNKTFDSLVM